jgi:hypothetical protein
MIEIANERHFGEDPECALGAMPMFGNLCEREV